LQIITGKVYSGKTSRMLQAIGRQGGRSLVLVPELFSHSYERRLAEKTNNQGAKKGEILTFRRLMNRVFAQAGGLAHLSLSEAGRFLYLHEAVQRSQAGLHLYRGLTEKPETMREILRVLDECKCWRISPEMLLEASEFAEGSLAEKLKDLGQIATAYDRLCQGKDPRDDMERLAEKIPEAEFLRGTRIYFDGFQGFTAQEMAVIEKLMAQKAELTFLLDLDPEQPEIFYGTRRTIYRLKEMAKSHGLPVEEICCQPEREVQPTALRHLAAHVLDGASTASVPTDDSVRLFGSSTMLAECEKAAGYIRKAVAKGARYRDFTLAARDFSTYRAAVEMMFQRYQIPVFLSEKTDIMEKPVMLLVTAALEAATNGYRYESIFAYLKTGLTAIGQADCDRLENYVLLWRIQGGKWNQTWDMSPQRFTKVLTEEDRQILSELNALRLQVITPLNHLQERMEQAEKGLDYVQAFYDFLLEIQADQVIQTLTEQKAADGCMQLAAEYRQLWDILMDAMEQFVLVQGEAEMTRNEFVQVWTMLLAQYDVATIPVSMDRVTCGSLERVCTAGVKNLILLGVNDGVLPRTQESSGIFTDRDREELIGLGIELSGTAEEKIWMEQESAYHALACPKESIVLSYHQQSSDGGEARPSMLIPSAQKCLTGLTVEMENDSPLTAPAPCFDAACAYLSGEKTPIHQAAYRYYHGKKEFAALEQPSPTKRGPLEKEETIQGLYGRQLRMTASRADQFYTCRFAFFMQYGMGAKKREALTFNAPAIGTFLHQVLEKTIRACLQASGGDPAGITPDMLEQTAQAYIQQYIQEELGGLDDKSARFRFLLEQMTASLRRILQNVLEEMQDSDFVPLDFELEFSEKGEMAPITMPLDAQHQLRLVGKVDRVDGYVSGDKLYLRVVDYKSGKKEFSLSDLWNGLNLQLFIYLFALEQKGKYHYRRKTGQELTKIVPAGALYVPAREPVVEGEANTTAEEAEAMRDKLRRRSGLLLENMAVLEAMSHQLAKGSRFLPVSLKKDGSFKSGAPLVSLAQMGQLADHIWEKLTEMGQLLLAGDVTANPYYTNRQTDACQFCPYHPACQFDEKDPTDSKRYFITMDTKEFWEKIGGETDGQTMDDGSADGDS
jgi:ATP-dependent helicase/nuclease subunit B